jgi:hypothetical protein
MLFTLDRSCVRLSLSSNPLQTFMNIFKNRFHSFQSLNSIRKPLSLLNRPYYPMATHQNHSKPPARACFSCGKVGHLKIDCPSKQLQQQSKPRVQYVNSGSKSFSSSSNAKSNSGATTSTNNTMVTKKNQNNNIKVEFPKAQKKVALIDIGVNLTNRRFARDLEDILQRSIEAGLTDLIITGTSEKGLR